MEFELGGWSKMLGSGVEASRDLQESTGGLFVSWQQLRSHYEQNVPTGIQLFSVTPGSQEEPLYTCCVYNCFSEVVFPPEAQRFTTKRLEVTLKSSTAAD